jgi:hypothetical protein
MSRPAVGRTKGSTLRGPLNPSRTGPDPSAEPPTKGQQHPEARRERARPTRAARAGALKPGPGRTSTPKVKKEGKVEGGTERKRAG